MFETLHSVDWASIEHAYGPAVDVPDWLRQVASGTDKERRRALSDLEAAVFHQDTWDASTSVTVPFLIELVQSESPSVGEVLELLARMSAGHTHDGYSGSDSNYFTSTSGPPDYPEAVATVEAIEAGRTAYVTLLGASDAHVRSAAAFLLGGMNTDPATCQALADACRQETETTGQASLVLALGRLAQVPTIETQDALVCGALAVAEVWAATDAHDSWAKAASDPRLLLLLTHPFLKDLPWADGEPVRLSARILLRAAHEVPAVRDAVIAAFESAIDTRLERGERIRPPNFHSHFRLDEDVQEPDEDDGALPSYVSPLTPLSSGLSVLLFPPTKEALLVDQLSPEQRGALQRAIDSGLPFPAAGVPFRSAEDRRQYLDGAGDLAAALEVNGETRPIWWWLHQVDGKKDDDVSVAILDSFLAIPPHRLLRSAVAILGRSYPKPSGATCLHPKRMNSVRAVLRAKVRDLEAAAGALVEELIKDPDPADACQLLIDLKHHMGEWPVDDRLLPILERAVYGDGGLTIFEALPSHQQVHVIATVGNSYTFGRLLDQVDAVAVAPLFVANFLRPDWRFDAMNTERCLQLLGDAPIDALVAAESSAPPKKRALIARVLDERQADHTIDLAVSSSDAGLLFTVDPEGESPQSFDLSATPKRAEYGPLGAELMHRNARRVRILVADADESHKHLGYQISLGLSDHVRGITLSLPGSSLHVGD